MMRKVILDKYKKTEFSEKVGKEIPQEHWELIFNDKSNTELSNPNECCYSKSKEDLSNSFYMDDKKNYKNDYYQNRNNPNYKNKKSEWRSNTNNYTKSFSSQTQNLSNVNVNRNHINDYINRLEMSSVNNFSIEKEINYRLSINEMKQNVSLKGLDHREKKFDSALFNTMNKNEKNDLNNITESISDSVYYRDSDKKIITNEIQKELDNMPIYSVDTQNNYNFRSNQNNNKNSSNSFTSFDIKSIYRINEKLKFPKEDPMWYIYHVISKSSFGPISSMQLEELYHKKNVDGMTDVRLIDIFKIRNKGSFAYFKLKDLENTNFLVDCIEPANNLLKYVDELNKMKREEIAKNNQIQKKLENEKEKNTHKNIKPKQKFVDFEDIINEPVKKEIIAINVKSSPANQFNNENKENIGIKIKNEKSIIDQDLEEDYREKKYDHKQNPSTNMNIRKKAGKKMKGKPVELDIKTGFFTLTQQEKEYEPIYICGDSESNNKK